MRQFRLEPRGLKTKAPPLFAAPEDADDFGHDVIRLDAPKESDADDSSSESAEDFSRQGGRSNPKTRPTKRHAWRARNVMADPFDDPLH